MKTVNYLCTQKYYKHKRGCPNFNSKQGCPPHILHISQEYDLQSINMLLLKFPFLHYISLKQDKHPDWNLRELSNQRHWQSHLRKTLYIYWDNIKEQYPEYKLIRNPEGQGVNVEDTLKEMGIDLEWPKADENDNMYEIPEYMYYVMLMGKELEHSST